MTADRDRPADLNRQRHASRSRLRRRTERAQVEEVAVNILHLLNGPLSPEQAIREVLAMIKTFTGVDSGAIRLSDGDDFPYFAVSGLPDRLLLGGHSIFSRLPSGEIERDEEGNPVPWCLCGNLLGGRPMPVQGTYTPTGGFCINGKGKLRGPLGGRIKIPCLDAGYESIALIPLRSTDRIVGLLQLSDRRKNHFARAMIGHIEGISASIGILVARMATERALTKAAGELEQRVQDRTAALRDAYRQLRQESSMRVRIEGHLEQSEARFSSLVETAQDIIWTADTNLRLTYVNPVVTSVLGYTVEEMMHRSLLDTMMPECKERMSKRLSAWMAPVSDQSETQASSMVEEVGHVRKDRLIGWLDTTMTCLRDGTGKPVGILGISRDVSERRHLETMKKEFLTNVAHELRSPLTSVLGYSELLLVRNDLTREEQQECLGHINTQAKQLRRLVDNLLDVSLAESGLGIPISLAKCRLDETIRTVLGEFREEYHHHRIETVLPERPIELFADEARIREVFENLLSNAVKFSPEGSVIRLVCRAIEGGLEFAVLDQGAGMTPQQVEQVFGKFYRLDQSDTAAPGLGVGMTVVKYIVEAHRGTIWVESRLGKGTAVRFTIPRGFPETSGGPLNEEDPYRG